ncbi:hypothetical protein [Bacillus toyonensis]|uniref:hypothetical protein n=1 Tax=Bacillus toyonensis TaxID=155322 RepID=UPI00115608A1|nr:hypothetical protein [Bacillus toyonensis]
MGEKISFFVVAKIVGKTEECLMNIIYIETKNQYKSEKENEMETIPIIKRVYYENGEIKFEILGEQKVPMAWLDK